jgi:hypothetical protein
MLNLLLEECCAFNAICKDNAAINFTCSTQKIAFPSTLTGHTTLVFPVIVDATVMTSGSRIIRDSNAVTVKIV